MKDEIMPILVLFFVCVGLVIAGGTCGISVERDRAIKAHAAHWFVDPQTGETKFEYLPRP